MLCFVATAQASEAKYDHILIRLQRRYGRGKKQLPAADRGGNALDADLRAGRRAERMLQYNAEWSGHKTNEARDGRPFR